MNKVITGIAIMLFTCSTALAQAYSYTITYNNLQGASHSNPTTYTIETPTFTLANPGGISFHTFVGWEEGNTTIETGSTGDKTFTAKWEENIITVTPHELSKTYGDLDPPVLTYTWEITSGENIDSVRIEGALTRDPGENAGQYTIREGDLNPNDYHVNLIEKTFTINPKPVTISGTTVSDKIYDGNTTATITGSGTIVGKVDPDDVSVSGGTAVFADKNANAGKTVIFSDFTLTGAKKDNYTLQAQPTGTATINKKPVTISGVSAGDKTYDGTMTATITAYGTVVDKIDLDDVRVSTTGTAAFADKNAGTNKPVAFSGFTLMGTDAANYTLPAQFTGTATITPKAVTISGVSAGDKTYDGNATATIAAFGTVVGKEDSDVVSVSTTTGTAAFADKNAGTNKTVTFRDFTLTGTDAANYTLPAQFTGTATIHKKGASISGLSVSDKTYDGTTTATITAFGTVVGKIVPDDVNISGATATFADKNAGTNKQVTLSGFTFTGTDKDNYMKVYPTATTATIDKAPITVSSSTIDTKPYDGTKGAVVRAVTFSGLKNGETLQNNIDYTAAATFNSKDVLNPTGQLVNLTSVVLTSAKANNYILNTSYPAASGIMNPKIVNITGISANGKVYDGTTDTPSPAYSGVPIPDEVIGSDAVSVGTTGVTATFDSKNSGSSIPVRFSGFTLSGAQSGNYQLNQPVLRAEISRAPLTVTSATIASKNYDGTTAATVSALTFNGAVSGETLTLNECATITAAFTDKDNGTDKPVQLTGITFKSDFDNYTVSNLPFATTGDINPKPITLTGITANDKVYDGTTDATYSGTPALGGGAVITGDAVGVDATAVTVAFDDITAGNQTVTFSGFALTGAQKDNYTLIGPSGSATIKKKPVIVSGISAEGKVYDGNTLATVLRGAVSMDGIIPLDVGNVEVDATTGTATFADKNAGTKKPVQFSGFTLTGAAATNYEPTQPADTVADITRRPVTIATISFADKVYDGTRTATVDNAAVQIANIVQDDNLIVLDATATFADKNAGTWDVTFDSFTLGGTEKDNYELTAQPANVVAKPTITPKPVTLSGISAHSRPYDGTTQATFSGAGTVIGKVEGVGDEVTVDASNGTATFADKDAGTGKPVTFAGFALTGAQKDNYELAAQPADTATITPLPVRVTPDDNLSKTYNAVNPELTYTCSPALFDGDSFSGTLSRATGEKAGKYSISIGTLTAGSNYTINIASKVFTIIPKSLTASTVTVASIAAQKYTGKAIKPQPKVTDGSRTLTSTDYTLTYSNNTDEGIATITIKGKGNYKDSRTVEFKISSQPDDKKDDGKTGGNTDSNTSGNINDYALTVSNADSIRPDYYRAHCGALEAVVTVTTGASSTVSYEGKKGNRFTVDISKGGHHKVKYSVANATGTTDYSLTIESRPTFEDVVSIHYNNVLLVKANTGYGVVGCEWYKATGEGKWEKLSSELSYSVGDNYTDRLDPAAEYKARLITATGDTLETCTYCQDRIRATQIESIEATSVKLYPNPVHRGDIITIEGVPDGVKQILIYDFTGRAVSTLPVATLPVETWRATSVQTSPQKFLQLPMPTTRGVYLVRVGEKLLKVVVE
ncbi:hypothetical protein AGMMS49982_07840 [Bacteroidia bacterium]|nr:hypothetical protein AGMMS49982_07840 [Bacteroidia bacterium]